MKIGIINHVPFIRKNGYIFVPTGEYLGLHPWIDHFPSVQLIKPEIVSNEDIKNYQKMPPHVQAFSLFQYRHGFHRNARFPWCHPAGSAIRRPRHG